jgi:hypothetical protein
MKKTKRFYEGGMDEKEPGWESKEAPAVSAPKQRIVTKEELAKSGLSLRDFLNKERGLTRRGESAPMPPAKPAAVTQTSAPAPVSAPVSAPSAPSTTSAPSAPSAPAAKGETYRTLSGEVKTKKSAADIDAENAARRARVAETIGDVGSSIGNLLSKAKQNYESTRPVSKQVQKEREQAAARGNLAKGGKVSSASSRGDGIAQRGKTRGKMC